VSEDEFLMIGERVGKPADRGRLQENKRAYINVIDRKGLQLHPRRLGSVCSPKWPAKADHPGVSMTVEGLASTTDSV
jgi:hypothetical protein